MKEYTTLHIYIIDEVKLTKKNDEEINYMLSEPHAHATAYGKPHVQLKLASNWIPDLINHI
jgi:hypothetical protein